MAGSTINSPDDLRRRASARLAEKIDPAKSRHKPISLLRQEGRRLLEQMFDTDAAHLTIPDRERFIDELLDDAPSLSPLDSLFRDDAVSEFMILAFNQVISRKTDSWLPASVQFRTVEHYRRMLTRMIEQAVPIGESVTLSDGGAVDVALPNGFRLIAVLPPGVMEAPPISLFRRQRGAIPSSGAIATGSALRSMPAAIGGSRLSGPPSGTRIAPLPASESGAITVSQRSTAGPSSSLHRLDPNERLRLKITERLILRLSANGVYDLRAIPDTELRRVISLYVNEFAEAEKLSLDGATQDRLTLEILTAMIR